MSNLCIAGMNIGHHAMFLFCLIHGLGVISLVILAQLLTQMFALSAAWAALFHEQQCQSSTDVTKLSVWMSKLTFPRMHHWTYQIMGLPCIYYTQSLWPVPSILAFLHIKYHSAMQVAVIQSSSTASSILSSRVTQLGKGALSKMSRKPCCRFLKQETLAILLEYWMVMLKSTHHASASDLCLQTNRMFYCSWSIGRSAPWHIWKFHRDIANQYALIHADTNLPSLRNTPELCICCIFFSWEWVPFEHKSWNRIL